MSKSTPKSTRDVVVAGLDAAGHEQLAPALDPIPTDLDVGLDRGLEPLDVRRPGSGRSAAACPVPIRISGANSQKQAR